MIRHATEQPRPLKELNPAVSDGLQQVVSRMMAKDPAQRYPIPDRAAQALQSFLGSKDLVPALEASPRMRAFLTWLETENGRENLSGPACRSTSFAQAQPPAVPAVAVKGPSPVASPAKPIAVTCRPRYPAGTTRGSCAASCRQARCRQETQVQEAQEKVVRTAVRACRGTGGRSCAASGRYRCRACSAPRGNRHRWAVFSDCDLPDVI